MSENVNLELAAILPKLGPDERRQVLEYARSLQHHESFPRRSLLDLVGTISQEDLQLMREAIEEDFERIHVHGPRVSCSSTRASSSISSTAIP